MLAVALQWFRPRYNAQLQLMAAQIRIPRQRINAIGLFYHARPENPNNALISLHPSLTIENFLGLNN
jgi:hypothetical protein